MLGGERDTVPLEAFPREFLVTDFVKRRREKTGNIKVLYANVVLLDKIEFFWLVIQSDLTGANSSYFQDLYLMKN